MSTNLVLESPDFDQVTKEAGLITSNAVKLLWTALNYEIKQRRTGQTRAESYLQGKTITDVGTTSENNLDTFNSLIYWYNTASSFNVTGLRNGVEGRVIIFLNVGAGTITFKQASGSSDAANQILLAASADKAVATNKSLVLLYINSRWRELSLA